MHIFATKFKYLCLYRQMKNDIECIVAACQRKESDAQKRLYDEYAPKMLGVCRRYCHSRDEAQDLLHDGFVKIFEKINQLEDPNALYSWMTTVMVNVCINYLQRNKLVFFDSGDMEELIVADHDDDEALDTDGYDVRRVLEAMNKLPYFYRIVFNMHEVEGLTFMEIAEILEIPEITARSYAHRARQILRRKLINK